MGAGRAGLGAWDRPVAQKVSSGSVHSPTMPPQNSMTDNRWKKKRVGPVRDVGVRPRLGLVWLRWGTPTWRAPDSPRDEIAGQDKVSRASQDKSDAGPRCRP